MVKGIGTLSQPDYGNFTNASCSSFPNGLKGVIQLSFSHAG